MSTVSTPEDGSRGISIIIEVREPWCSVCHVVEFRLPQKWLVACIHRSMFSW